MTKLPPIRIHSFESMGTFDGPGLRLVVFLQGCNFKCVYCANPDTIDFKGGKLVPAEEILRRAISERAFFGKKGGITFSGGEPTVQAKELIPLFRELKKEHIHICLDTNGSIMNDDVKTLFSLTDMFLLDIKEINPVRHMRVTKHSNEQTLRTLDMLAEMGKPVRIRCVIVPGYSDFEEDLEELGKRYGSYKNIDRIEVLPYHTYGKHKYEVLGWKYELENVPEPSIESVDRAVEILGNHFKTVWRQ